MSRKKVSTTVYLNADQVEALRALSARTRVPVAEYVREGVQAVLEAARARGVIAQDGEVVDRSERLDLEGAVERVLRRLLPAGLLDGKH
jgi:hypothetical protein